MRWFSKIVFSLSIAAAITMTFGVPIASAHGDDGSMEVLESKQVGSRRIRLEVAIPYSNDGELADEATVTATLTGPDGQTVRDVALLRTEKASYAAVIDVPTDGVWTIAVASTTPDATADIEIVVRPDTAARTTTVAGAGNQPTAEAQPEPDLAAPAQRAAAGETSDRPQDGGGVGTGVWLAGAAGLLALIVAIAAAARSVSR